LEESSVYLILKLIHVLAAITALGINITYGVWLARAARAPEHLSFVRRGVKILDDRMANPAYGLLLITGFAMAGMGGIPFTTPWLLTAIVLYVIVVILGVFGFMPTLKRQIALAEAGQASSSEFGILAGRARLVGIVLAVLVVAITFLMVVKPGLWATS
jgi:uncharacterized membrane protein